MKKMRDSIPQGLRFDVLRRDNFTCRYCGRSSPTVELHCDHIKAASKGGETTLDNLITACSECNGGKRVKDVAIAAPSRNDGLVGLFGFTFVNGIVQYQFRVIRTNGPEAYLVQTYSWLFGDTSTIIELGKDYLLSDECELYPDARTWHDAFTNKHQPMVDQEFRKSELSDAGTVN